MKIIDLASLSLADPSITTSGTIFSDNLTSGANWNAAYGSATYSSSGATFTTGNTLLVEKQKAGKPASGKPLMAQATFTTPSSGTPLNMKVMLYQDVNNNYELRWQNDNNLVLYKTIAGATTAPSSSGGTPTEAASTTYTFTLQLDTSGNLTANLYSGTGTGGSLLKSLTGTDTALTGPFSLAVGGDANVVATGAQLTGQTTLSSPSIVEAKIPLWWNDGTSIQGVAGRTTAGVDFVQDGSGSTTTVTSGSPTKLFTLSSSWPASMKFAFETYIWTSGSGGTVSASLWDITSNSQVTQSSVTVTNYGSVRSGNFTLTPSHTYGITIWQNTNQYADLNDASLIVFPS